MGILLLQNLAFSNIENLANGKFLPNYVQDLAKY